MQIFYVVQHLIDQEYLLIIPVMHPFLNSVVHLLLGGFTRDSISNCVWSVYLLMNRCGYGDNSLYLDLVHVYSIGWCSYA